MFKKIKEFETKLDKCYSGGSTGYYGRARQNNYIVRKGFPEEVTLKVNPEIYLGDSREWSRQGEL